MIKVSKTTGDIDNNNKSDQNYYDNDTDTLYASEGDSGRDAKRANKQGFCQYGVALISIEYKSILMNIISVSVFLQKKLVLAFVFLIVYQFLKRDHKRRLLL